MIRKNKSTPRGFTLIELMVASFISLIVLAGLGQLILVNQKTWNWGRERVVLQQSVTQVMDRISWEVRASNKLLVLGSNRFRTYDELGNQTHEYRLLGSGSTARVSEDGVAMSDLLCSAFTVASSSYNTNLTINLELEDDNGNRVAAMTRSTIRNKALSF